MVRSRGTGEVKIFHSICDAGPVKLREAFRKESVFLRSNATLLFFTVVATYSAIMRAISGISRQWCMMSAVKSALLHDLEKSARVLRIWDNSSGPSLQHTAVEEPLILMSKYLPAKTEVLKFGKGFMNDTYLPCFITSTRGRTHLQNRDPSGHTIMTRRYLRPSKGNNLAVTTLNMILISSTSPSTTLTTR